MGQYVFGPVSATGVVEFAAWTRTLIEELRRLMADGEIRAIPHFEDMLVTYKKILTAIDGAARSAPGPRITRIDIPMSANEFRHLDGVGRSIETYVGVIATRGVVDMNMAPDVAEAFEALAGGKFSD
ncbi:MAG: hypothetical protein QOE63_1471 [Acidimicrobiaceae bacterium]|jgi:hypothetical protein